MNPALIFWCGLGLIGLSVSIVIAYMAGMADGAEQVKRALQGDPRKSPDETDTGVQCAGCWVEISQCKCPMGLHRGKA